MKLFLLFALLVFSSCTHRVSVSPDDLISQIQTYKKSGEIQASHDGKTLVVTKEMEPQIHLKTTRECTFMERFISGCDSDFLGGPLDETIVNSDTFSVDGFTQGKAFATVHRVTLREEEVLEVELSIDHVPDNWTPTWAFGLTVGGPTQFIGYQLQWFPLDMLVFDAAVAFLPHTGVFAGGGLRLRPYRFDNVLPFVGVATSWSHFGAVVTDDLVQSKKTRLLVGPRLGVDFEFFNKRFLVGAEIDLFYDITKEGFIYDLENQSTSDWKPYGGIYFAYQI